ncbi:MAG TPA: site-specific integrase [Verrucomicrobiae bacterium]|nr:site-specific integrase [Verrucomicrobiae bacterium]
MRTKKSQKSETVWQKTQYANLIRYVPSGTYFARFRVKGKLVWRGLKTDKISVAQLRLADEMDKERKKAENVTAIAKGKMTVGDAISIYEERVKGRIDYKPRTKNYHAERIKGLLESWPGLKAVDIVKVTKSDCLKWAARYGQDVSATTFNHTIGILRAILEIGTEVGLRFDNPTKAIKRVSERSKKLRLPEPEQFQKFVQAVENSGSGFSKHCANLIRFLAFGGFRIGEAKHITWSDCDFKRGIIIVHGEPVTGTKGRGDARVVPMIPDMRNLLEQLQKENSDAKPNEPVMRVRECQKAMDNAAEKVEMPRITHHDLRHLFATRCIESGVDIPTVSRWLGHKDGGALAMRVYGHLRDTHSTAMAQKVSFLENNQLAA